MANIKSAEKRARQSKKRYLRNKAVISALKTSQKKFLAAVSAGNSQEASILFQKLTSSLDKAAKKGVIHKNRASKKKSSLNRTLSKISEKSSSLTN